MICGTAVLMPKPRFNNFRMRPVPRQGLSMYSEDHEATSVDCATCGHHFILCEGGRHPMNCPDCGEDTCTGDVRIHLLPGDIKYIRRSQFPEPEGPFYVLAFDAGDIYADEAYVICTSCGLNEPANVAF